jgi:hypothetical protein
MLVIGAAADAASYTHAHAVAAVHGWGGRLAWADAVVLELMSTASGLELRRRRRHTYPVAFPAVVLVCAVALSLETQVVQAEPSPIGWIAAALPALGGGRRRGRDHHTGRDKLASLSRNRDRCGSKPAAVGVARRSRRASRGHQRTSANSASS